MVQTKQALSVDVLHSAAYTFIDIWRAIPATKLLATSSYKLGFYRYGWGSRTFRNITTDSIYILIQGWLSMTQLLLEHSWLSHYILSSLQRLTNNSLKKSREITIALRLFKQNKVFILWVWLDLSLWSCALSNRYWFWFWFIFHVTKLHLSCLIIDSRYFYGLWLWGSWHGCFWLCGWAHRKV